MLQVYNFIKEESLVQVFSCEFCEIFKNTLFTEHIWETVCASSPFSLFICLATVISKLEIISQLFHYRNAVQAFY